MRMQRSCPDMLGDISYSSQQNSLLAVSRPPLRSSRTTSHHPLVSAISSRGSTGGACSPLLAYLNQKPSQRFVLLMSLLIIAASMFSSYHILLGTYSSSRSHSSRPPTMRVTGPGSGVGRAHLAGLNKLLHQPGMSRKGQQQLDLVHSDHNKQQQNPAFSTYRSIPKNADATEDRRQQQNLDQEQLDEQAAFDEQIDDSSDLEGYHDPLLWYDVTASAATSSTDQRQQQQQVLHRGSDGVWLKQLQQQLLDKQHRLAASLEAHHKPPAGSATAAATRSASEQQQQQQPLNKSGLDQQGKGKQQAAGDSGHTAAADASSSTSNTSTALNMSYPTSDLAAEDATSSYIMSRSVAPTRLQYPVWWHGPIWSGSGYGSEANNYVLSLLRTGRVAPGDIWVAHHGDAWRDTVVEAFSPEDRVELDYLESLPDKYRGQDRPAVVVCHSVPTNWAFPEPMWSAGAPCPPHPHEYGWVYSIGRTMFETDRLPAVFVPRLNAMNEIWVPSQWQKESFIASGVLEEKLRVVPEGVNTTLYDPAQYTPLDLENMAQRVFGKTWEDKVARRRGLQGRQAGLEQQQQQQQQEEETKKSEHSSKAGRSLTAADVSGLQQLKHQQQPRKKFTFISSFKWEQRKGWDILLQAYLSEFTVEDDVELYILTKPYEGSGNGFKEKMRSWADKLYGSESAIANAREKARLQGKWPAPHPGPAGGRLAAALGTTPRGRSAIAALLPKKAKQLERKKRKLQQQQQQQQRQQGDQRLVDLSISRCSASWANCTQSHTTCSKGHQHWHKPTDAVSTYQQHVQRVIQDIKQYVGEGLAGGQQQLQANHHPQRRLTSAGRIQQAVLQQVDHQQRHASLGDSEPGEGSSVEADIAAGAEREAAQYPTLYVVDSHISDADFPRFYKAGDAFVLPSRGEGWGRPHVEAMSMGLPIISTNWSGITAYLDESVGYPIEVEKLVHVQGGSEVVWWFRGQRWAQPSVQHLRKLLRRVYSNRTEAAARGAAARKLMVEKYSPEPIADILVKELKRIEGLIP